MKPSGDIAKDGFGWPFWGGISFSYWMIIAVYTFMFHGPGWSLSKVTGSFVLIASGVLIFYGFVKFTKVQSIVIHKMMSLTTAAVMIIGMISIMLFSDAWSLEKALGIS